MPSFEPPLGCTTVITIPPGDQRRFAHLTSQLSFGQDEDDTGSWEIWTDLALVREDGKRVYGDGAWHAMKFERVEDEKEEDEVLQQHGSGPVFRLQSASSQPAQAYRPRCLQARGVISASVGSAWSYTFRRVLPNGEVHWLGQEGGNGVIRVDIAEEVQSSSTTHTAEDGEGVLQGMAVQLPSSRFVPRPFVSFKLILLSHASPKLQLLPAESHVTADMIFVIKTPPIHMPFYIITYDARPPPAHGTRPTHVVSIAPRGQSYDIEAGSSHAKSTAQNASSAECAGAALEQAISKSVGANQIIPATVSGANAADIVAFFIHGSEIGSGETDTACSYLVIYAAASSIDRLVWIGRSFGTTDDAPLVVLNATIQHMLLRSEDQGSNEKLPVWVPSGGPVAQILELGTFCQLRGTGDGKLINVCLPGATSIEVGEEEIDQDAIDGNTVKLGGNAASNGTQRELGAEQDGDGVGGTSMDADEASVHTDATPELEESIISQDEQPESKEPALWILRLVGRFLMNLFNALFSTFGFGQKRTTGSDKQLREAGDDDDDEIEAGARTPVDVDERTPLLQVSSAVIHCLRS